MYVLKLTLTEILHSVSPKTLATVFEYCLDQAEERQHPDTEDQEDSVQSPQAIEAAKDNEGRLVDGHKEDTQPTSPIKKMCEGSSPNVSSQSKSDTPSKTVLLVEDNPVNLKVKLHAHFHIGDCVNHTNFRLSKLASNTPASNTKQQRTDFKR